jgi:hypothetical protein
MNKSFGEMSPRARVLTGPVFLVSLAVVVSAERDIQKRSEREVRGSKFVWRVLSLNAIGAVGYFRWGRLTS